MKFVWINVIAVIIALSSIVMERPFIASSSSQIETLQSIPLLNAIALRDEFSKRSEKTVRIAQDFIPIVTIATFEHLTNTFLHYIPIYSLVRQKEYFLLI